MSPVRLLRFGAAGDALLSARVFEEGFRACFQGRAEVEQVDVQPLVESLERVSLAPCLVSALQQEAASFPYLEPGMVLSPDYQAHGLVPLLVTLRNLSGSEASVCVIAHSPALYPLEWALLSRLLGPRDLIIAPSRAAASVISAMSASLAPRIRVVPHPLDPSLLAALEQPSASPRAGLLSLSRLVPGKLIHRQIDALALLHSRGLRLRLRIAGSTLAADGHPSVYVNGLRSRAARLGVADYVEFLGQVREPRAKARLLQEAQILLCPSCTFEESFGKAVIEAKAAGTAVVSTRWNGLPETVGAGGLCAPMSQEPATGGWDVSPEALADAVMSALQQPSLGQAGRREVLASSHPDRVGERYLSALREASAAPLHLDSGGGQGDALEPFSQTELPVLPAGGLLARVAPLPWLSWRQLFQLSLPHQSRLLPSAGPQPQPPLDSLLIWGVSALLEPLFAHCEGAPEHSAPLSAPSLEGDLTQVQALLPVAHEPACAPCSELVWLYSGGSKLRPAASALPEQLGATLGGLTARLTLGDRDSAWALASRLTEAEQCSPLVLGPYAMLALRLEQHSAAFERVHRWLQGNPHEPAALDLLGHALKLADGLALPREERSALLALGREIYSALLRERPERAELLRTLDVSAARLALQVGLA